MNSSMIRDLNGRRAGRLPLASPLMTAALALFASAALALHASAALTARSYVQRGLVACYDGIDNAGAGTHDPSSTIWKDLTGNGYDGSLSAGIGWNGNCWTNDTANKGVALGSGISENVFSTGTFTIQFACKSPAATKNGIRMNFFGQYQQDESFNIERANHSTHYSLRLYGYGLGTSPANYDWNPQNAASATVPDRFFSASVSVAPTFQSMWIDGQPRLFKDAVFNAPSGSANAYVGGEENRQNMAFVGSYYAFRVYNRVLTADEIAVNAAVDAIRFGGSTEPLPDGWETAADGTLRRARGGDAADGLALDLRFTGSAAADGLAFSTTQSADDQLRYAEEDVILPIRPTVTNAAAMCLYFPSPSDTAAGTTFRQHAVAAGKAVQGDVATVFVRFRWDGAAQPSIENFPTIFLNGYTSWYNIHNGFGVRLRTGANDTKGYPVVIVSKVAVGWQNAGITTTGAGYVNAGKWVDLFASVYPSPTDPTLSNADIWYCEVPSWNSTGYFEATTVNHRHFGDRCGITNVLTTSSEFRLGCEPNPSAAPVSGSDAGKSFRGAIAAVKGWNRVLSENERWTVMAELGGVPSWTDLETSAGRTFTTCNIDADGFEQGRNGTATSFLGGGTEGAIRWRAMTTTWNSNTLLWNAPKDGDAMPVVYSTKISNLKAGNAHPAHLEANGTTVWSSDGVEKGEEIKVEIGADLTRPGLNELRWVYDTETASNWMIFGFHRLKLVTPPNPFVLVVR